MSIYNHICSLGFNCHPAFFIKRNGLKKVSYPSDWIMSSLKNLTHFIDDDFKLFLDASQYTFIMPRKCGHKYYADNMFWHKSPLSIPEDYEYYVRCVERFRELLNSEDNKLFLMMIINGEHGVNEKISDEIKKNIIEFNRKLKERTTNYKLVLVVNYPNKTRNKHVITTIDNIDLIEVDTVSSSNGILFEKESDNLYLDIIFKINYKFDIKE